MQERRHPDHRSGLVPPRSGSARAAPDTNDEVTVHYRGTLLNGEEFDSGYKRGEPISFPSASSVDGRKVFVDARRRQDHLLHPKNWPMAPARRPGAIPPYAALVFEVELIKVNAKPDRIQARDNLNPGRLVQGFFLPCWTDVKHLIRHARTHPNSSFLWQALDIWTGPPPPSA